MKEITKKTLVVFWRHAVKYKLALGAIVVLVTVSVAIDLIRPFLIKDLFDTLAIPGEKQADRVLQIIIFIAILAFTHNLLWRVISFTNNFFQARIMSDLLNTCYRYLHHHSLSFFNNSFVGSIVTKVRRLSRSFETFTDSMVYDIYRTVLRVIVVLGVLFWYKPIIGAVMLIWIVIYMSFALMFTKYKLPYDLRKVEQDTKTTAHLADTISNHKNVKLFAAYDREVTMFERITDQLYRLRKKSWDLAQYAEIFQGLSMVILEFVVMYVAYQLWLDNELTIGDFAFLQAYLFDMFHHLWDISRYIRNVYESIADANEMTVMLETPHGIVDASSAKKLEVNRGAVEFSNVVFEYNSGQPVLNNFNLSIEAGEKIALVGKSGGGKSTIVKILFRFMDLKSGSIKIDGQNISQVTQESLREQVSLVPQEPLLFHRSLKENIRYGKPEASDEEVIAAAKAANCHEFISKFEFGYDTLVGERGVKLSGGERQRVAIARAILKNSPILVLDEATSSLDSESEKLIQEALHNLMKDKTTIVIAHRLSTIREMDRIVVIEDGKIKEQGKHEELVKAEQGIYQKLWDIQVGGFA